MYVVNPVMNFFLFILFFTIIPSDITAKADVPLAISISKVELKEKDPFAKNNNHIIINKSIGHNIGGGVFKSKTFPSFKSVSSILSQSGIGYLSEYKVICGFLGISYTSLDSLCRGSGGEGWRLASVESKEANDYISNLTIKRVWLGATFRSNPSLADSKWYWDNGIRGDKIFATAVGCLNGSYCNFKPGTSPVPPTPCGSGLSGIHIVMDAGQKLSPTRYWKFANIFTDCENNDVKCYACERSPCNVLLDCNTSIVDSVNGYYPNCHCQCKFGYIGKNCSKISWIVVNDSNLNNGTAYNTSFDIQCETNSISYDDVEPKCKALGAGWSLGTIPNNDVNIYVSEFARTSSIWFGGNDVDNRGEWRWKTGRLKEVVFYNANSLSGVDKNTFSGLNIDKEVSNYISLNNSSNFSLWDTSEPSTDNFYCYPIFKRIYKNYLSLKSGIGIRRWQSSYGIKSCDPTVPKCYACERSICSITDVDCVPSNIASVSGYYPNCTCACKDGYFGDRCDKRQCSIKADCHGRAINVTGKYPNCTCNGCPKGYHTPDCSSVNRTMTISRPIPVPTLTNVSNISSTTAISTIPITTTIDPNRTCPFRVESCKKDVTSDVTILYPLYKVNVSLNGLQSALKKGISIILPMSYVVSKYNYSYNLTFYDSNNSLSTNLYVKDTIVRGNAIIATVFNNAQSSPSSSNFYLHLITTLSLIDNCCFINNSFNTIHSFLSANIVNDTLRIGELTLLPRTPLPVSNNPSTYSDDRAQEAEKELMQRASKSSKPTDRDYTELFGPHTDHIVLRALSPFALMITINDDGYSGIIISNLIVIAVLTAVHLSVTLVLKFRMNYTFIEACTAVSFPSMPIYVLYALLPGTAVASGELVAKVKGLGFLGMVILLIVIIASGFVPYFCLSRALLPVPIMINRVRSKVELLFPTTVIAPIDISSMYTAMIGYIRSPIPLWPTLPVWSPLLLFIFAAIQPRSSKASIALYVVLVIIHCLIILIICVVRPLSSMSLNAMYVLGILPTVLLCITLAATAGTDSYVTGTVPRVFLILFTVVNTVRLAIAVASPLIVFQLASFYDITKEDVAWIQFAYFGNKGKLDACLHTLKQANLSFLQTRFINNSIVCHPNIKNSDDYKELEDTESSLSSSSGLFL